MALLAKAKNTIEIIGRNIPIPFSETTVSPDIFSDKYTKNPSKKKFNMMLRRPKTNWSFLFLNIKIETRAKIPDTTNAANTGNSFFAKTVAPSLKNLLIYKILQKN